MHVRRLKPSDRALMRELLTMMAEVFDEQVTPLSDAYLDRILRTESFWAVAAFEGTAIIGGLTAHVLPMTRAETSELFVYDLAVHKDHQRRGVGRQLIAWVTDAAAQQGAGLVIIPAEADDDAAVSFYRAVGGVPQAVTFFSFSREEGGPRN